MNHRDRYTEHRPLRSSLTPHQGRSPSDPDVIDRLAHRAYHENGGIYFTADQLKAMHWQTRATIESAARDVYGPRRRS